jgi:hypothetical protein
MAIDVVKATPQVIETLKKVNRLVNSSSLNTNTVNNSSKVAKIEGQILGSTPLVPAKVKEGNGIAGYFCDIYGNGLSEPPTDQGTVFLANGASSIFALPPGTVIFVQKYNIPIHGGVN